MKNLFLIFILFLVSFGCQSPESKTNPDPHDEEQAIKQVIENYKTSINQFDTLLASKIWLTTEEVSFIHPRGHEKGWKGIKTGIYEMFGSRFSHRNLKSYDEVITLYDDMAVVEFYWVFDAIFSGEDPANMQTRGRETQVIKKFGNDWKIVHVHYSGIPVTGEREGF